MDGRDEEEDGKGGAEKGLQVVVHGVPDHFESVKAERLDAICPEQVDVVSGARWLFLDCALTDLVVPSGGRFAVTNRW